MSISLRRAWLAGLAAGVATLGSAPVGADPITGVYRLTARVRPTLSLEVAGGAANANGTAVQLWRSTKSANQQWLVERQTDGTYKLYAYSGQNSLQMLDYAGGVTTSGNPATTWEDTNSDNQRWYFRDVGDGWSRIIPKKALGTLQTLEIAGGAGAAAGSKTQIGAYAGGDNQVFRVEWAGVSKVLPNPKKGLGGRPSKTAYLNASWFYTWGGDRPADTPTGIEFVPMAWGYYGNANNSMVNWLSGVKAQPGVTTILGFNEPDHTDQANLTVAYALEGFQYLSQCGLNVGSPACADDSSQWMRDFMAGATKRGYRIDFVGLHSYVQNPSDFLGYVDYIHNLYGKPLWITEFAPADWSGQRGVTVQQATNYMRAVVPELNRRSYVLRYAWFSADTGDGYLGTAGLVNADGSLTDLGRLYSRM
ncbi:MAG TPA: glycosyl hydrolase [Armatimonadota bacterium]|jgi:hypothetical protein